MKKNSIIGIGILVSGLFATSCETDTWYIEGDGNIVTETLELEAFTGINMLGAEDVVINYGNEQAIEVTGDANIIERIKTDVVNETWNMELEHGNYRNYKLKYTLTLPQINKIFNDGASKVVVNDFINQGDLEIKINGASDIELNRMENTENLYISADGAGHIKAKGAFPSLKYLDIYFSGSGEYSGFSALAKECRIEIDGAAKCEVSVDSVLDVFIDGAGVVKYKGTPSVSQHVSGLGVVQSQND